MFLGNNWEAFYRKAGLEDGRAHWPGGKGEVLLKCYPLPNPQPYVSSGRSVSPLQTWLLNKRHSCR